MVITRIIGGLGNQMFQYAAGRSLAGRLGTELKLDISGFEVYQEKPGLDYRRYGLGVFKVAGKIASADDLAPFAATRARRHGLLGRLTGLCGRGGFHYFREPHFHYARSFEKLAGNVYLDGYWNSEQYFAGIAEALRDEFAFREMPAGRNAAVLGEIEAVESVGIHVRRGDYVTNPKAHQVHGVCGLPYYHRCVEQVVARLGDPHFFIFSDDPQWARDNLAIARPTTIVDHNGPLDGHEDLRLLSRCRHQIIANSTFSWWAAWLNRTPGKLVLAPARWFASGKYDTRSLIPAGWVVVEA